MGNSNIERIERIRLAARNQRDTNFYRQMIAVKETCQRLGINNQKALQIGSLNVWQVVQALNNGSVTSQALVASLALRCSTVSRQINFFTATDFENALEIARNCDSQRQQSRLKNWTFQDSEKNKQKCLPALFGVPVSIKDVFQNDSMATTIGLASRTNYFGCEEGLIKCVKNSGMIPFIKTNVPQLVLTFQTMSHLWGRTKNPWNKNRVPGGSSGGEGAIISSRCSYIGIGSDIGGSIRTPSEFCGLFGLKPCSGRISNKYHTELSKAFTGISNAIPLCLGPMAKSAQDLALFMDVVTTEQYYRGSDDPYTRIVPFSSKTYKQHSDKNKKLRIGYIKSLIDFEPTPASKRALSEAIEILRGEGHELIQVQIPNEKKIIKQFIHEVTGGKGEIFKDMLKGQQPMEQYKQNFYIQGLWRPTFWMLSTASKYLEPRSYFYMLEKGAFRSIFQYQSHIGNIHNLRSQWVKYWRKKQLDLIVFPGFGCQAFPHSFSKLLPLSAAYTFIWNVLDMSVGSVPITVVKQNEQQYQSHLNDIITGSLKLATNGSRGMPVGIQVVGLPYQEEKVLGLMKQLEKKVRFYQKNPLPDV